MKSGVASHIMAVECLMAAGLKPKGDVYINVVVDEEVQRSRHARYGDPRL